jgi:hypothetical protein
VHYAQWLAAIYKIAKAQMSHAHPSGCLFMVLTDHEYKRFPLHTSASDQAIDRPDVAPPPSCPLDAPPVLRDSYNREVAKYESFLDDNAKLLQAIIVSVLPEDMMTLRDPVFGDLLPTIHVVLAHVKTTHGNVTAALPSRLPPPCGPLHRKGGPLQP